MECSICYDSLSMDKNLLVTECGHKFHYSCYKNWTKDTCPLCRQDVIKTDFNILNHITTLFESDDVDKRELVLYLNHYSQGIVNNVPAMYKALILHNTKLLVDVMEDPIYYIMKNKLYNLLQYYDYNEYKFELLRLDDVNLVKYINFEDENVLSDIVSYNCKNLLLHLIDNKVVNIDCDKVYSTRYDTVFHKVNLLGLACLYGQIDLLPILLLHFDINAINMWHCTALYPAILSKNLLVVKWLVQNGIDINKTHVCGNSPLYFAMETGNNSIVYYLINKGAQIDEHTLYSCVGYTDNVRLLKKLLSLLPSQKIIQFTKISNICSNRNFDDIKHILCPCCKNCYCIKCRQCNIIHITLLQNALFSKKYEMILLLLSFDKSIKQHTTIKCEYHTDIDESTKNFDAKHQTYVKNALENDAKQFLYSNQKYPEESESINEYIWNIVEREDHVSYKHQRKKIRQLIAVRDKKIQEKNRYGSGLGLYRSYLYN